MVVSVLAFVSKTILKRYRNTEKDLEKCSLCCEVDSVKERKCKGFVMLSNKNLLVTLTCAGLSLQFLYINSCTSPFSHSRLPAAFEFSDHLAMVCPRVLAL